MKKVYFILDKKNFKISSSIFHFIDNDNLKIMQMLRDLDFSGIAEKNKIISFIIVSIDVINNYDYILKAHQFLEYYRENGELAFNDNRYRKIVEFNYKIDPEQTKQEFDNIIVNFSINYYKDKYNEGYIYSNPEIQFK